MTLSGPAFAWAALVVTPGGIDRVGAQLGCALLSHEGSSLDPTKRMEETPQQTSDEHDTSPPDDHDRDPSDDRERGGSGRGLAAGYTLAGGLVVGLGIGYLVDRGLGTEPLWTVSAGILFMLAGFYQVVKDSLK